jgi:hypothetical protein
VIIIGYLVNFKQNHFLIIKAYFIDYLNILSFVLTQNERIKEKVKAALYSFAGKFSP